MTHLTLNFLGPFQVTLDEEPVTTFKSIKVRALLAYLAVEAHRPHQREHLAGLLWPDQPHRTALSNLRYALSDLRRAIGDRAAQPPFLSISRETLQFNLTDQVRLDVADFNQALAEARRRQGVMAVAPLEEAVGRYRGDFLAEFPGGNQLPFEEWLLFTREQYTRQLAEALYSLAELHSSRGDYQTAQQYARRRLQLDPWQEETHRQLMRLLALSDRRDAALAQYETCRRVLAAELGVEPSRETTSLFERIRAENWPGTESRDSQLEPVDYDSGRPDGPPPFVARQRELAKLDHLLTQALAGRGRVALITGEAGSGKSALIREFIRRATTRHGDLVAAGGSCSAFTGLGDPYQPFREILQMLAGDIEAKRAGGEITVAQARRLWQIFPATVRAIRQAGPDLIDLFVPEESLTRQVQTWPEQIAPAPPEAYQDEQPRPGPAGRPQADLFAQVTRVLHRLAQQQPLLLTLDDLQWTDAGSAGLLFHLGRHLAGSRILIVGAYRPDEVRGGEPGADRQHEATTSKPDRHPLAPVVNELRRELGDIQIDLGQANTQEFVEALLDAQPNCLGPAFRQTLARQTGGNALFTVELLRGLQERGDLVQDQAGRWGVGAALNWERLPDRVEAAVAERIGRLPPAWQALLAVASVEGETFTAELVAQMQGLPELEIIRLLSGPLSQQHGLVQSQSVIRLAGRRLSRYRFRHHLFQKYLYSRLDEAEQSHLHEAVGLTLETLYAGQAEEMDMSFQLARHFEAAGLMAKAVDYLLRAGRRAVRLSANKEAIALFTHGLALLENLPESTERAEQELELRLALNGPLFAFRGWGASERAHAAERAYRLSRQIGQTDRLVETLFMQADICRARGEYEAALELGEQLQKMTQHSQEPLQILLAHMTLAETQFFRGHLPAARPHFEATIAGYRPDRHRALMSLTGLDVGIGSRAWLTWALWILGYPDQALARSREALAMAQELGQPFTSSFVLVFSGCSFSLLRGETEKAGQELDALAQIMAEEEIAFIRAWGMVYQGWWLATQGQVEAAVDQMQAGLMAWQATGAVIVGSTRWPLIELYQQIGQVEVGLTLTDETLAAIDRTGERLFEAELHRLKGEFLLLDGGGEMRDEAERYFLQAIEIARRQKARSWELRATMSLARLWQQTGKSEEARQMLADIYNWFTEGFDTPDLQAAKVLIEELSLDPE